MPLPQANIPIARAEQKYNIKQHDKCWKRGNVKMNREEELGVEAEESS